MIKGLQCMAVQHEVKQLHQTSHAIGCRMTVSCRFLLPKPTDLCIIGSAGCCVLLCCCLVDAVGLLQAGRAGSQERGGGYCVQAVQDPGSDSAAACCTVTHKL